MFLWFLHPIIDALINTTIKIFKVFITGEFLL